MARALIARGAGYLFKGKVLMPEPWTIHKLRHRAAMSPSRLIDCAAS